MSPEEFYTFFVNLIMAPLVLVVGISGNIAGLIVINRKKLKNIGPIHIYKFLFIADSIYLPQIVVSYMVTGFSFDPTILSSLSCKIYQYLNFVPDAISPWLLVYISLEKFVSISMPQKRFFLRDKSIQTTYITGLVVFVIVYYIAQPFCFDIINIGSINETVLICSFASNDLAQLSASMDTVHRVILPFTLMVIFSALLIGTIFRSRSRISSSVRNNRRLNRDIRFSVSSLSMNLLFVVLNLPLSVLNLLSGQSLTSIYLTVYLFYLSYGINFYVILLTNSIFRYETFSLFKRNRNSSNQRTRNQNNRTL